MKFNAFSATTAISILLAVPALGTPVISGKYAFSSRILCQPTHTIQVAQDSNGQYFVNGVNLPSVGLATQEVGTANFNSVSGNFGGTEIQDLASPSLLQIPGQTQGFLMSQRSLPFAGTYSNTATTVTLNWPQGGTYAVAYGAVKNGIAMYMAVVGLVTINAQTCSQQIEFSRI